MIHRTPTLTEQIQDLLRERILQGEYSPEERMPSEARLAEELDVSRASVRTALAALAAEGLIRRRHGDGTYPTPAAIEVSFRAQDAWNIEYQIQLKGQQPSMQVIHQERRAPTAEEKDRLGIEVEEQVIEIRRLFFADEEPVMLAVHVIRTQALVPGYPEEDSRKAMLDFLIRYSRRPLNGGDVIFKAALAEQEIAQILQVAPASPLLLLEALLRDDRDQPLFFAREFYRGEHGFLLPIASLHS